MPSNQEVVISLRDIFNIVKRNRRTVITSAIGFCLFTTAWTLTEPVKYMAVGSFGERSTQPGGMSAQFTALMMSQFSKPEGSEATSAFKSETLLGDVVKKLGLQVSLSEKGKLKSNWVYLPRIPQNLKTAYYQWVHTSHPLFPDTTEDVAITSVVYENEVPYDGIHLAFEDEDTFVLKDKKTSIRGQIGDTVETPNYRFTVQRNNQNSLKGRTFDISLSSVTHMVKVLANGLTAKVASDDKSLINITFTSTDRHRAAKVLNGLMDGYGEFLLRQHKITANAQLAYLHNRQSEMNEIVRAMMEEHATKISKDLLNLGFPNAQAAMDFLSSSQAQQQQRVLMIDLEKMMLRKAKEAGYSHYDNITPHGDPGTINGILREIRELHKQRDNIQLTLQQKEQLQDLNSFHQFLDELETLRKNSDSARELLVDLETDELPAVDNTLVNNSKYLVSHWLEQLQHADIVSKIGIKQQFSHYLNQMIRLFDMHADIIRERMSQQQNSLSEYEGIELGAAREIYLNLSKQIQELEAQTLQHHFIIENIQRPDFEIGSLSGFLQDGVSQQMIQQASQLSLQITDYHNRSEREKDRLREEINVKKGFLVSHLKQASQLLVLRQKLLKEKMRSLQVTTLALIQQQVSLLENHLQDYINSRLSDLDHEYEVITQHQRELNKKMASLPTKWSDEQMIHQQMDLNKNVAGEVSRLIETRNLTTNLELNRSTPIDRAYPPLKPVSPKLPLFILIGLFMGSFLSISTLLCKTLFKGVPISKENLLLSGYRCCGTLSRKKEGSNQEALLDSDLETLRATVAALPRTVHCQTLIISEKETEKYSRFLASLLSLQGLRVLYLDLAFTGAHEKDGLLQYLEGTIPAPKLIKQKDYTEVTPGGASRFAAEQVAHKRFKEFLAKNKPDYDWIIASTIASPLSGEMKELRRHFEHAVLVIDGETQQELPPTSECDNISFVVIDG